MRDYKKDALLFKAFCDESRLKILEQLQKGEQCACNLLEILPISQSTLSHHMKILVDSGVVSGRKDGKWVHYSISEDGVAAAQDILTGMKTISDIAGDQCMCND